MINDPAYFRQQAEVARRYANAAPQHDTRSTWRKIAEQFDYLADLAERFDPWQHEPSVTPTPRKDQDAT